MSNSNIITTPLTHQSGWPETAPVQGHAADWLHMDKLVTEDIRKSFAEPMQLNLIQVGADIVPAAARKLLATDEYAGWLREITITAGRNLLIHAISFVPQSTCDVNPWFTALDGNILGSELAKRRVVKQEAMRFLASANTPAPFHSQHGQWARRSVYDLDGGPLLLIEHMTDKLLNTPRLLA